LTARQDLGNLNQNSDEDVPSLRDMSATSPNARPASSGLVFDSLALLIAKATFVGLRIIVLYLCASKLDRASFGLLSFAFTLAEISRFIGDWGTDTLALRHFSHPETGYARSQLRVFVRLRMVSSVVAFTIALIGNIVVVKLQSLPIAILVSLTSVTSLWLNLSVNWLQARGALRPVAFFLLVLSSFCLAIEFAGVRQSWPVEGQLAVLLAFEILIACGILSLILWKYSSVVSQITRDHLRTWLRSSTPIAFASLTALAYGRFDQFYIKAIADPAIFGDYSLAIRVLDPLLFVAAGFSSTMYVRISALVQADEREKLIAKRVKKYLRLMLTYAISVGVIASTAMYFLLTKRASDYHLAEMFLVIGLFPFAFRCINLCMTASIQAHGDFKFIAKLTTFNVFVFSALILMLGRLFGPTGAIFAVGIGEGLNACLQYRRVGVYGHSSGVTHAP
jgi:O-antigen/teichoic acid export membrane protein